MYHLWDWVSRKLSAGILFTSSNRRRGTFQPRAIEQSVWFTGSRFRLGQSEEDQCSHWQLLESLPHFTANSLCRSERTSLWHFKDFERLQHSGIASSLTCTSHYCDNPMFPYSKLSTFSNLKYGQPFITTIIVIGRFTYIPTNSYKFLISKL